MELRALDGGFVITSGKDIIVPKLGSLFDELESLDLNPSILIKKGWRSLTFILVCDTERILSNKG